MQNRLLIQFFILLLLTSCNDNEEDLSTTSQTPKEPQITITTPTLNAHYNEGDDIIIQANISDDNQVNMTYVQIKNLENNSILYNPEPIKNHETSYTLNLSYKVGSNTFSRYLLIIKVTDLDGNLTEKQVQFWVN